MFSRKYYEFIAEHIRAQVFRSERYHIEDGTNALLDIALTTAAAFQRDNKRFNRKRFMKACGFVLVDNKWRIDAE